MIAEGSSGAAQQLALWNTQRTGPLEYAKDRHLAKHHLCLRHPGLAARAGRCRQVQVASDDYTVV